MNNKLNKFPNSRWLYSRYVQKLFCLCFFMMASWTTTFSFGQTSKRIHNDEVYLAVASVLDSLNARAARADFNAYFALYADSAIFMGTDATERWKKHEFAAWSKKYFDRGKAWNFTSVKRNIYTDPDGRIAWFDELLSTQMKLCRGSGVLQFVNGRWLIIQYALSATIPNSLMDQVTILKTPEEDSLLKHWIK